MAELSEKAQALLDSINLFDEWGFRLRQDRHWLPETAEQEIERLEFNLACYEQFILNGSRFPEKCNKARRSEFERLTFLKSKVAA